MDKCCKLLRNRNKEAIRRRAEKLKLKKYTAWKPEEDAILRQYYMQKDGVNTCRKLLPNRTERAINTRTRTLGISIYKMWTEEEDKILRENYAQKGGVKKCMELLKRSKRAIVTRANTIGAQNKKGN